MGDTAPPSPAPCLAHRTATPSFPSQMPGAPSPSPPPWTSVHFFGARMLPCAGWQPTKLELQVPYTLSLCDIRCYTRCFCCCLGFLIHTGTLPVFYPLSTSLLSHPCSLSSLSLSTLTLHGSIRPTSRSGAPSSIRRRAATVIHRANMLYFAAALSDWPTVQKTDPRNSTAGRLHYPHPPAFMCSATSL